MIIKASMLSVSLLLSLPIFSAQSDLSKRFDDDSNKWFRKGVLTPVSYMWKIVGKLPGLPSQSSDIAQKTSLAIEFEKAYLNQDACKAVGLLEHHTETFDTLMDPNSNPIRESSIIHRYATSRCTPQDRLFLQEVARLTPHIIRYSLLVQSIRTLTAKKEV